MNRYISNLELYKPFEGYICRQNAENVSQLRYGRAGTRFEKTGCAIAAIYNIMKLLGKEQSLPEIIRLAERLHMPWLFGLFGTKPRSLTRYFDRLGVEYFVTRDAELFAQRLKTSRAAIICTWNSRRISDGIHFYTLFRDGDKLKALNYRYADIPLDYSLSELNNKRFIVGYIF